MLSNNLDGTDGPDVVYTRGGDVITEDDLHEEYLAQQAQLNPEDRSSFDAWLDVELSAGDLQEIEKD